MSEPTPYAKAIRYTRARRIEPGKLAKDSRLEITFGTTLRDWLRREALSRGCSPEMRALAEAMWEARGGSTPKLLQSDEWHLPFVRHWDYQECLHYDTQDEAEHTPINLAIRVSVARCARVSYLSNDTGKSSTIEEDLKLYDRLMGAQPLHASPAEHQATPDSMHTIAYYEGGAPALKDWDHPSKHGNFRGWRQYRKTLAGEHRAPLPEGYSK